MTANPDRRRAGGGQPPTDCGRCFNRRLSDWKTLSTEEAAILAAGRTRRDLSSGESVFRADGEGSHVFCVAGGTVALRQTDAEGNSVLLQLAYPGEVLGFAECLTGGRFDADAEALGPCSICRIERGTVMELVERNSALGRQFLRRTAEHLAEARRKLVHNATLSNRDKFARLLTHLAERHGRRRRNGETVIHLPLSRRDLASLVGTRHETLSRIIARLDQDGLAHFSGRSVLIPRIERLQPQSAVPLN